MAYSTPTYDLGRRQNDLTTNKGLQDIQQNYGRFLSQERFRRSMGDANRQFKDQFPQVAQGFNRRGMYHSGLRKEGQQRNAQDFQRQTDRFRFDYAAEQNMDQQQQALRDAAYQQQMLALVEEMQRARAGSYDPYAAIRAS